MWRRLFNRIGAALTPCAHINQRDIMRSIQERAAASDPRDLRSHTSFIDVDPQKEEAARLAASPL
jgi:hypothetical protein